MTTNAACRAMGEVQLMVAMDRAEDESCERGTEGCCVDHSNGYPECGTW